MKIEMVFKQIENKKEMKKQTMGEFTMNDEVKCNIPLTIERRLKAYTECERHIERHEILWHEWNHNKRWLTQIQELILPSFPSYSRHDSSHSEAIIHNIEMLLGEENIRELSATDCFAILHTVYIHDIGMCITHADREEILKNKEFYEYLQNLCEGSNSDFNEYARILLQECFKKEGTEEEQLQYILESKLKVYYAVIYLIGEFRRKEHGEVSEKRLVSWIDNPEKLGIGFSTIDIPNRLFYIIASCAAAHTKWDFQEILDLKQEDSGFVLDYVHPRFIAVLLQLGDALDLDNNRFHPLTEEFLGRMPKESSVHWRKHKAIRRLRITNEKISISADCKNQDELRLVRMECDMIQDILKNATFYWSVIKPKKSKACLPTLDQTNLLLNGRGILPELVEVQFEIAQEKAFELLIGNNIYTDQNFVFLRELLQNAVDATKIQYYREYSRKCSREEYIELKDPNAENNKKELNPLEISKRVSPLEYPIVIELSVKKRLYNEMYEEVFEDITEEDRKDPKKNLQNCECGVLVKIRDRGTGISEKDIKQIADVGTSYEAKKEEIKQMPKWLQPTGTFGIGLQSVFLAGKSLKAYTHAMESQPFDITFYPRQEGKRGYINVMPRKTRDMFDPFGSCFELFVPHGKKELHKDNPETWNGQDPFEEGYEDTREIRHSRELLKQMALYLGEIVGEPLFPIQLYIKDCQTEEECTEFYDKDFRDKIHNLSVTIGTSKGILKEKTEEKQDEKQEEKQNKRQDEKKDENKNRVTWVYNLGKSEDMLGPDEENNIYKLDCDKGKLYIWNQKYNTYARIGIDRILTMRAKINSPDSEELMKEKDGIRIYYKGILTAIAEFEEDANLIEYMDIKDTLAREYLKLSRKGFSKKGYVYLHKIYREIIRTARIALAKFDEDGKSIEKIFKTIDKTEELRLSLLSLIYFAMVSEKSEAYSSERAKDKASHWTGLLDYITKKGENDRNSVLYNIPVWEGGAKVKIPIFEVINPANKYMVVSEREANGEHRWKQHLVKIATTDYNQKIKRNIEKLRKENTLSDRVELMRKLKGNMDSYEKGIEPSQSDNNYLTIHKEQVILKWILDNIPTMAIFASTDGNLRVNVLDVDVCDSVYFDLDMKALILERIQKKAVKTQRFSVPVWSGFGALSLEETRDSIEFVKRGKLSRAGYGEMIFPLTGEEFGKELENYKKKVSGCMTELLKRLDELIMCSVENSNQNKIKEFLNGPANSLEEYLAFFAINKMIPEAPQLEEDLRAIKECFCNMDSESISLGARLYQDYCIKSKDGAKRYKHLKDYVQLHGKMKPSDGIIDALYERYMYEIAQVIVYLSYRTLKEEIRAKLDEVKISSEFMEYFVKYLRGENDEES